MRVGINGRALVKPEPTGVSRYTEHLLAALAERDDDISYLVFGVESLPARIRTYDCVGTVDERPAVPSGLRGHVWEQATLPRVVRGRDIDVLHSPAGFTPLLTDVPTVLTVHDISPITHPEWFSRGYTALYRTLTPLALRSADHVITISNFSKSEISERYPWCRNNVSSIYNGLNPVPEDDTESIEGLEEEKYFLFLGAIDPRKNIRRLLAGYDRYRRRVETPLPLIFAGPARDVSSAVDHPASDGVRTLGYVSDAQRNWLYHNATAFVFPSLYEGFGLPIIEAMSADTPVLTSNRGAMSEVAGDAALLIDPENPSAVADGLERISAETPLKSELIAAGRERAREFRWEMTAEQTVEVYRTVG